MIFTVLFFSSKPFFCNASMKPFLACSIVLSWNASAKPITGTVELLWLHPQIKIAIQVINSQFFIVYKSLLKQTIYLFDEELKIKIIIYLMASFAVVPPI